MVEIGRKIMWKCTSFFENKMSSKNLIYKNVPKLRASLLPTKAWVIWMKEGREEKWQEQVCEKRIPVFKFIVLFLMFESFSTWGSWCSLGSCIDTFPDLSLCVSMSVAATTARSKDSVNLGHMTCWSSFMSLSQSFLLRILWQHSSSPQAQTLCAWQHVTSLIWPKWPVLLSKMAFQKSKSNVDRIAIFSGGSLRSSFAPLKVGKNDIELKDAST